MRSASLVSSKGAMAPELKDFRVKPRLASLLNTYSPGGQITLKAPRQDVKAKAALTLPGKSTILTKNQSSSIEIRKKVSAASVKRNPPVEQKVQKIQPIRPSSAVNTTAASKARSASSVRVAGKAEVCKASIRRPRPISSPGEKPSNQLKSDGSQAQSTPDPISVPPPVAQRKPSLDTGISARRQPLIKATGAPKKTDLPFAGRPLVSKSGRKPSNTLPLKHLPQRERPKVPKEHSQLNAPKREPELLTAEDLEKPMTAEELWEKIEKFSEWLAKTVNNRKDSQILNSLGQIRNNRDRWTPEKTQDSSSDSVTDQTPRRRSRPKRDVIPYEQSFQIRKSICSKIPGASPTIGREDLLDLYPKLESNPCLSNPSFFSGVKVPAGSANPRETNTGLRSSSKKCSRSRSISPSLKLPSARGCLDEDCFKDALLRSFQVPDWAEGYFQRGDTKKPDKVGTADSTPSEVEGSTEAGVKPGVLSKLLSMYQNSDNSVVTDVDSDSISVESAIYNVTPEETELDK